jgi:hypothetical protein
MFIKDMFPLNPGSVKYIQVLLYYLSAPQFQVAVDRSVDCFHG